MVHRVMTASPSISFGSALRRAMDTFRGTAALVGLGVVLLAAGCRGPGWEAGPDLLAPPRQVALALGDPLAWRAGTVDPVDMPDIKQPKHVRPCCAFGMDLKTKFQGVLVAGYTVANVISAEDLGHHEYDNGFITLANDGRGIDPEKNGLVYTCRGGFVDTAHVRDNADLTLYVGLRIAQAIPAGATIAMPGDGAARHVVVRPIPPEAIARQGRLAVAAVLAQWVVYQLSIWHEIASWYGVESVPGFSERVSAFTPEDRYSNAIGIKVGAALLEGEGLRSRDDYNRSMDAWIAGALRRLDPVSRPNGRLAMGALDGLWWTSEKVLPDWTLVMKRNLGIAMPLAPWRIEDALPPAEVPEAVRTACKNAGPPLALSIPDGLGPLHIPDIVTVELEPDKRAAEKGFPFPDPMTRKLTSADFPSVLKVMRDEMMRGLGGGFDQPGKPKASPPGTP